MYDQQGSSLSLEGSQYTKSSHDGAYRVDAATRMAQLTVISKAQKSGVNFD
jgi:hypothetical protein